MGAAPSRAAGQLRGHWMLCCFRASEETALRLSLDLSLWRQVALDFPVEQLQLLFFYLLEL